MQPGPLPTPGWFRPRNQISRLAGRLASSRFSRPLIPLFARWYRINLEEADRPLDRYESLQDFFSRGLRLGARPTEMDPSCLVAPVDGVVGELGSLTQGQLIQAKSITYTASALLGDPALAERYEGGRYIRLYLSPGDYHRIHAPVNSLVASAIYLPGTLRPVHAGAVGRVRALFPGNERLVTLLASSQFGQVAMVKVGALLVGGIKASFDPLLETNLPQGRTLVRTYPSPIPLEKGEELGRFLFGSTVILLLEPGPYDWALGIQPGARVAVGQPLLWRSVGGRP